MKKALYTRKEACSKLELISGVCISIFYRYSDVCDKGYDFRSDVVQKGTGHFSQLVWQKTTDFGIGRAMLKKNGRFCTVVVARYFPKGNIKDEFTENVKQGGYSDRTCENFARELNKKTDLGQCDLKEEKNKQLGKFIETDVNNAIKNAGKIKLSKPMNMTKEKEKARLNYEIQKVTEIINRLEKDGSSKTSAQNLAEDLSHAGALVASENGKSGGFHRLDKQSGESAVKANNGAITTGNRVGFSDLGGTGSPVIVYHGVTGFFESKLSLPFIVILSGFIKQSQRQNSMLSDVSLLTSQVLL